jgi:SSS family solute:Na+ symporter
MNLVNVLPLIYLLSLGVFLQNLFGGPLSAWVVGGTLVVLGYSVVGGFRSVVLSDMVQFAVMCLAVALVVGFSMLTFGGLSWLRASEHIPASHWNALGEGIPMMTTLVWGLVAAGTLVDPNFYHRCLAAKDAATARRGIFLATLVWVGFDFCTTFGALYARAVLPEADSASAYLQYGVQVLPAGLKGFFLAGILATILSTLDSYLFLSGTLVAYDLAPRRWRGRVGMHHAGTITVALIAVGLSMFAHDLALVDVWKILGGFTTACLVFPLVWGLLLPGRLSERAFLVSCFSGVAFMVGFYTLRAGLPAKWQSFEPFYVGVSGTLLGMLGSSMASRLSLRGRQALGILLGMVMLGGIRLMPVEETLRPVFISLQEWGWLGRLGYMLLGGMMVLLFAPVTFFMVLAGVLFGFGPGLMVAMGIKGIACLGGFWVGRGLWQRLQHHPFLQSRHLATVRQLVDSRGVWVVGALRMVPFLHFMSSNLFFGSLSLRTLPYVCASLLGLLPGTALMVYGGSIAYPALARGEPVSLLRIACLVGAILLFAGLTWRLTKRFRLPASAIETK